MMNPIAGYNELTNVILIKEMITYWLAYGAHVIKNLILYTNW